MNWTKEEVFALMDEKKRIEKEMAEWTEVLNNEGGVGLHEPLVDEEGNLKIYILGFYFTKEQAHQFLTNYIKIPQPYVS